MKTVGEDDAAVSADGALPIAEGAARRRRCGNLYRYARNACPATTKSTLSYMRGTNMKSVRSEKRRRRSTIWLLLYHHCSALH